MKAILSYGINFDERRNEWVIVSATKFDGLTRLPNSWAVRVGGFVMSKVDGQFNYEPSPSSRTKAFFNEYRFDTAEDAENCYNSFDPKK